MPWEREIYVGMLITHLRNKAEKEKLKKEK